MNIDLEWMRSMMTVTAFATFIGIVCWAWSAAKRNDFDVAARSVLDDGEREMECRNAVSRKGGGHE